MKRLFLLFLLLILSATVYAQLRIGVKAALTTNTLHLNPDTSVVKTDMYRVNAAIITNYRLNKLFSSN